MEQSDAKKLTEAFRKLNKQLRSMGDFAHTKHGLTMLESKAMEGMCEMEEEGGSAITPSRLSRHMGMQAPIISPILTTLERKGNITRRPDPDDRRSVVINLTQSGRETALTILARRQQMLESFVKSLGQRDTAELIRIISKMEEFLGQEHMSRMGEE